MGKDEGVEYLYDIATEGGDEECRGIVGFGERLDVLRKEHGMCRSHGCTRVD